MGLMDSSDTAGRRRWKPFVIAVVLLFSGNWSANVVDNWFRSLAGEAAAAITVTLMDAAQLVVFLAAVVWLYFNQRSFFQPRTRHLRQEAPLPTPHLVMFLSLPGRNVDEHGVPNGFEWKGGFDDILTRLTEAKQADEKFRWPWEQNMRSLRPHFKEERPTADLDDDKPQSRREDRTLKSITLVCSTETLAEAPKLRALLSRFSQLKDVKWRLLLQSRLKTPELGDWKKPNELPAGSGWDYEDFDAMVGGLRYLLGRLQTRGIRGRDVMIDFTSGSKVVSVAAATVTFDLDVRAQYIGTNDGRPQSYDVVVDRGELPALGM